MIPCTPDKPILRSSGAITGTISILALSPKKEAFSDFCHLKRLFHVYDKQTCLFSALAASGVSSPRTEGLLQRSSLRNRARQNPI
jgi:hypothetical protein